MTDDQPQTRSRAEILKRRATTASVAVALLLVIGKTVAWLASDSVAILSSLVDSFMDMLASGVTFYAVRLAHRPPTQSHRFGKGKAESLGALSMAGFVGASAIAVSYAAIDRLINPVALQATELGLITMGVSIVLTFALVAFQTRVAEATGSVAIRADRLHYAGDLLTNVAALLALLVISATGLHWIDAVTGLAITAYLATSALRIARGSLHELLDREIPSAERDRIEAIVAADPDAVSLHDLRTRKSGQTLFIEFHVELDGDLTLSEAHDITDRLEAALMKHYPAAEITIHQEPAGIIDERLDHRLER